MDRTSRIKGCLEATPKVEEQRKNIRKPIETNRNQEIRKAAFSRKRTHLTSGVLRFSKPPLPLGLVRSRFGPPRSKRWATTSARSPRRFFWSSGSSQEGQEGVEREGQEGVVLFLVGIDTCFAVRPRSLAKSAQLALGWLPFSGCFGAVHPLNLREVCKTSKTFDGPSRVSERQEPRGRFSALWTNTAWWSTKPVEMVFTGGSPGQPVYDISIVPVNHCMEH